MKTPQLKASTAQIAEVNPQAIERYKEMRATLMDVAGVDRVTLEIVIAMQLALLGHEVPFKIHALRVAALGVSRPQLQGLILAGVGVTLLACEAARALGWLDEAMGEHSLSQSQT